MPQQNLPSFISSNGTYNPFGTKRKALLLCGKKAKASRLFWETTKIPSNSMKAMMIETKGTEKIKETALISDRRL